MSSSCCGALQQMTCVLVTSTFVSSAGMPVPSCWAGPWSPPQPPSFSSSCASTELFRKPWLLFYSMQFCSLPSWEKPAWTSSLSNSSAFMKATIFNSVKCLNSTNTPARNSYGIQISWYLHRCIKPVWPSCEHVNPKSNWGLPAPEMICSIQGKTGKSKIITLQD